MYGVQNSVLQALQAHATMRLHSLRFDASRFIAIGTAFSNFVPLQPACAGLEYRRGARVQEVVKHQGKSLRGGFEALTIRPSGAANTPLRSVSAAH